MQQQQDAAHQQQRKEEEEEEEDRQHRQERGRQRQQPAAEGVQQQAGKAGGWEEQASRGRSQHRRGYRSRSFSGLETLADESHAGRPLTKLRRTRSVGRFDHTPWAVPWDEGLGSDGEDYESPTAAIIRMAGYPLETYTVVTEDGYVLRMERIPRPGAPDVALFMHGILDTSLTWVSSGVTGSQAFAAWDQGFDVWLGSSRSNPPRVATDPSRQGMGYWRYTLNEGGIYDVAAQVDKLHEVKGRGCMGAAAAAGGCGAAGPPAPRDPYNLRVVAHSLGGASLLIYLVMRLRSGRPHHVQRLVLLTPAGFHPRMGAGLPWVLWPILKLAPYFFVIMRLFLGRGAAAALYLPTAAARLLTFKAMLDVARLPALGALLRALARLSLNGDASQWDRAAQLPHYNARAMPAGLHFIQLWNTGRFRLYDYGSQAANLAHYGHPTPPDIASEYWRLDIPVDICAGRSDGVIPPSNVRRHVSAMAAAGVDVTYREFDFGHLDFTFNTRDELRFWVMSKLTKRA
ncbi:MAG: Alpha/Beta hydrolase protein [Monoraphidium minutum]|nr:MAG: Alpha/Beta hydrolase protein [Monoraphidium minutum]